MLRQIHRHFTLPVIQNVAATAVTTILVGGTLIIVNATLLVAGGCPEPTTNLVTRGDLALLKGEIAQAKAIASDAVAAAPQCACSNLLMASVDAEELQMLPADASADKREVLRSGCYRFALKARGISGNWRAAALLQYCSAVTTSSG